MGCATAPVDLSGECALCTHRVFSPGCFMTGAPASARGREQLTLALPVGGRACPRGGGGSRVSGQERDHELLELHAHEAVGAIRRGDISAEHYAAALLRRCAAARPLNAFITLAPERVLEAARDCDRRRQAGAVLGPLHGLPIAIKDSINTHDYPTTAGTPALRQFRPAQDAPVVGALRAGGALILGKTNLHELSFGWTSANQAFGPVRNPYDVARIAGGSSGGSAAAVAARLTALALAADTEGSIRVPASLCGIAGF